MTALLFYFSVFHYKNIVRFDDCGEAMGDDQSRSTCCRPIQRGLYVALRRAIKRGGRLIKDEYSRVF